MPLQLWFMRVFIGSKTGPPRSCDQNTSQLAAARVRWKAFIWARFRQILTTQTPFRKTSIVTSFTVGSSWFFDMLFSTHWFLIWTVSFAKYCLSWENCSTQEAANSSTFQVISLLHGAPLLFHGGCSSSYPIVACSLWWLPWLSAHFWIIMSPLTFV